jgi:Transposase
MERRKFTREFKCEAVKLIKDRGVSYAQAAEDLGVHTSSDCACKISDRDHRRNRPLAAICASARIELQ